MKRLEIGTSDLEVEKPSGGGRGPNALYSVEVVIDGRVALFLTRNSFKESGQMAAFVEILSGKESR